jgi:hypothetical protein
LLLIERLSSFGSPSENCLVSRIVAIARFASAELTPRPPWSGWVAMSTVCTASTRRPSTTSGQGM